LERGGQRKVSGERWDQEKLLTNIHSSSLRPILVRFLAYTTQNTFKYIKYFVKYILLDYEYLKKKSKGIAVRLTISMP
jgi:hypothetical protein